MDSFQLPLPAFSPLFYVPAASRPCIGRETDIAALAHLLHASDAVAVVTGHGGLGKTHLVATLAYTHHALYPGGIFWFDAAQIAASGSPQGLALPEWESMTFEEELAHVQQAWRLPIPRLLIFDNVDDPAVLAQWRPARGGCRILVTSRLENWPDTHRTTLYALQPLPRAASRSLLVRPRATAQEVSPESLPEVPEADAICTMLGDEPLALTLAGAYLATHAQTDFEEYLRRLDTAPRVDTPPAISDALARCFAVSYTALIDDAGHTKNAHLLHLAAHCATAPIPESLLRDDSDNAVDDWNTVGDEEDTGYDDESYTPAEQSFEPLYALGLLTSDTTATPVTVRCHPLIAALAAAHDPDPVHSQRFRQISDGVGPECHDSGERSACFRLSPWIQRKCGLFFAIKWGKNKTTSSGVLNFDVIRQAMTSQESPSLRKGVAMDERRAHAGVFCRLAL